MEAATTKSHGVSEPGPVAASATVPVFPVGVLVPEVPVEDGLVDTTATGVVVVVEVGTVVVVVELVVEVVVVGVVVVVEVVVVDVEVVVVAASGVTVQQLLKV